MRARGNRFEGEVLAQEFKDSNVGECGTGDSNPDYVATSFYVHL